MLIFTYKCSDCDFRFSCSSYCVLWRMNDGTYKALSHPGEWLQEEELMDIESVPQSKRSEYVKDRRVIAQRELCLKCGETVFTKDGHVIQGCSCDGILLSAGLIDTEHNCPKCKSGKISNGAIFTA